MSVRRNASTHVPDSDAVVPSRTRLHHARRGGRRAEERWLARFDQLFGLLTGLRIGALPRSERALIYREAHGRSPAQMVRDLEALAEE